MFGKNFDMRAMFQKQMDRMFKKVDNVCWDLMTGSVGVAVKDGSIIVRGELDYTDDTKTEADFQLSEQLFDAFAMPIPAFAQMTSRDKVCLGDMIVQANGNIGWVKKINPKSFKIMTSSGTTTDWAPPKLQTMGMGDSDGIMVVRSLMQMGTGNGESNLQSLQTNLMPLMMMGGGFGGESLDEILPMMLMMSSSGAGGNMASMMPMMMMSSMMKGGKLPFQK